MKIPVETGLVKLSVNGSRIKFPAMDEEGRLWLGTGPVAREVEEKRLDILVHRHIEDDIPLLMTTRIDLEISGENRELLLGKGLLDNFVPISLDSELPVRLENDGRLRVQVKPGSWTITLVARHDGPVSALTLTEQEGSWAATEVWVFEAQPRLRLVDLEGVNAVDPQQTMLPDGWKHLPAYLVRPGDTMKFVQRQRGNEDPGPDSLSLRRNIWLDFDGGGYSIQDRIGGEIKRGWRLEVNSPMQLGRVSIKGDNQLITRIDETGRSGVEIRQRRLDVSADSRIDVASGKIPAIGWNHDFQDVSGKLHLPPGWRLFYVSGVDEAPYTWIDTWNLLDLFLLLIVTIAIGKLWGILWGVLALLTMLLIFPEPNAPFWIWPALLVGEALLRVIPKGRFYQIVRGYKYGVILILILIAVPFCINQIRQGMHPSMEYPWQQLGAKQSGNVQSTYQAEEIDVMDDFVKAKKNVLVGDEPMVMQQEMAPSSSLRSLNAVSRKPARPRVKSLKKQFYEYDKGSMVQTGLGMPRWQWNYIPLRYSGPVKRDQMMRLFLLPPYANLVLAFARTISLILLVLVMLGITPENWRGLIKKAGLSSGAAGLLILGALTFSPGTAHAEIPSDEMLNELARRLTEKPQCLPACASSGRMALEVGSNRLKLRLEVDAAEDTAIPVPGNARHWLPERVYLDGRPAKGLARTSNGQLWMFVPSGVHQIILDGPLPPKELVQIPLPLLPHRVSVRATGWRVDGIGDDGAPDDNIQLTRLRVGDGSGEEFETETLPPFVRVERDLTLGLTWEIETVIYRMTPAGSAVLLEVPLLPGESVTSEDVRIVEGKAQINMGPTTDEFYFRSVLTPSDEIKLKASTSVPWTEVWRLQAHPIWHTDFEGIPPIQPVAHDEYPGPQWRPWPEEQVTIRVTKPEGLAGQTVTIDNSSMTVSPGVRATDVSLAVTLRSSLGGQHTISLPEGAQLQSVVLDGQTRTIRQDGDSVKIPISPGEQNVTINWQQQQGISAIFNAPQVDLGLKSVNSEIAIKLANNRWVLSLSGPRMGPAVLFWPILVVFVMVAIGLGRIKITPLKTHSWILLGLGLTQVPAVMAVIVAGWLLALGWRKEKAQFTDSNWIYNLRQIGLAFWTLVAMIGLIWSIEKGLLGYPDMQIVGNGSDRNYLRWYQDIASGLLPSPGVISLHLNFYRVAMLLWALWLAYAMIDWLRWGWDSFGEGGLWKSKPKNNPPPLPEKDDEKEKK
jgi:hypothetical protein